LCCHYKRQLQGYIHYKLKPIGGKTSSGVKVGVGRIVRRIHFETLFPEEIFHSFFPNARKSESKSSKSKESWVQTFYNTRDLDPVFGKNWDYAFKDDAVMFAVPPIRVSTKQ
jgi:hypothetical protein